MFTLPIIIPIRIKLSKIFIKELLILTIMVIKTDGIRTIANAQPSLEGTVTKALFSAPVRKATKGHYASSSDHRPISAGDYVGSVTIGNKTVSFEEYQAFVRNGKSCPPEECKCNPCSCSKEPVSDYRR